MRGVVWGARAKRTDARRHRRHTRLAQLRVARLAGAPRATVHLKHIYVSVRVPKYVIFIL